MHDCFNDGSYMQSSMAREFLSFLFTHTQTNTQTPTYTTNSVLISFMQSRMACEFLSQALSMRLSNLLDTENHVRHDRCLQVCAYVFVCNACHHIVRRSELI
jgi:hypothetical protein